MTDIIMPKVGDAMTEGKVVRWYRKAGDAVKKGEPLLEIETDKVNLDLEAEADGTLGEVMAGEGEMVPVGQTVARILGPGEKNEAPAPQAAAVPVPSAGPQAAPPRAADPLQRRGTDRKDSIKHSTGEYGETTETKGPRRDRSAPLESAPLQASGNVVTMPQAQGERRRSSPLARRIAHDLGVPLESVQGSGPGGRIIARDVQTFGGSASPSARVQAAPAAAPAPAPQLEERSIPLTAMRRTIARRLAESTGPIPHFYLTADYDVTNLVSMRQQMIDIVGAKLSLNDFIVRAAALTLRHHPAVNSSWGEDAIAQHGEVHIGIAVSTPEGLITPVIRNADRKQVPDIAAEVRALAEKARNRKLLPSEYQGATFTISNLGAWGIEEFTAIINPPNVAILAVGAAEARPVVVNGQVVVRDRMKVTMSCDHRVVDGAAGAEFLETLRLYIEQPVRIVM